MEKICLMPKSVLQNLITYALWLLECSHHMGRTHACMFFGVIYPFKILLDMFDSQDGLRAILNVITTQPVYLQMKRNTERQRNLQSSNDQSNVREEEVNEMELDLSEDTLSMSRQSIKQVSSNLKRYFECHLGFTADKLRRTIGKNQSHPHAAGPIIPPYKVSSRVSRPSSSDFSNFAK
jgi:HIV-1 Vpr-binding protein